MWRCLHMFTVYGSNSKPSQGLSDTIHAARFNHGSPEGDLGLKLNTAIPSNTAMHLWWKPWTDMKVNSGIRQWSKIETWSTPTTPTSLWGDIKLGITELVSLLPFWSLRWLLNRKGKHCWWSSVDAGVRSSWTFDELCSCVFWSPIP